MYGLRVARSSMVDWDQVERLRSKGWDWTRIADEDRVGFTPEAAGGDAGRQLRTLYYQRRSKSQRRGGDDGSGKGDEGEGGKDARTPWLLRIGYLIAPLFGVWALLTLALPWPGLLVPTLLVLLLFVVSVLVLLFALFRAEVRWTTAFRVPLILGIVLGLSISGGLSLIALSEGCPTLSHSATGTINSWDRYGTNALWKQDGAPVFFFYGSIACPYCSASSWAMTYALQKFGTLSGTTLAHSNPLDSPANIPEVDMSGARLVSQYVALQVFEGTDDSKITTPPLGSCQYQAYVTTYDGTGTIPFVVIGGQFVHAGQSLVDPSKMINGSTGSPYSPQEVKAQMDAQSGPAWDSISPSMYTMEAIIVKLNGGSPASVASDPNVHAILTQIS